MNTKIIQKIRELMEECSLDRIDGFHQHIDGRYVSFDMSIRSTESTEGAKE